MKDMSLSKACLNSVKVIVVAMLLLKKEFVVTTVERITAFMDMLTVRIL